MLTGRRLEPLRALATETKAELVVADLSDPAEVARVIDLSGDIDVFISNAALPGAGRVESLSVEDVERAVAVNLRAPMVMARCLAAHMVERGRGHIVFVSSLAAAFPTPGLAVYNATKAGLSNYALSLRGELAGHGVGVSVIDPGPISEAGMWAKAGVATPLGLTTRPPGAVGAAVVEAIERNRARVSVASLPLRVGAVLARAAPALMAATAPRLGADKLTDAMAEGLRNA